jgi:tetrahydromethanopterin S-methyltransferase subunit G
MVEHLTYEVAREIVEKALAQQLVKLAEKLAGGKRLTQFEMAMLLVALTRDDLGKLEKSVRELRSEMDKKIDFTNSRIDDLSKKIDFTNSRIDDLSKKIDFTNSRIDDLKGDFDEKIELIHQSLEKRVDDLRSEVILLRQSVDSLRDLILAFSSQKKREEEKK